MAHWALVTGATSGIGESFTRLLAQKSFNVVLVARNEERLHERAQNLREKFGIETVVIVADLSTSEGVERVMNHIKTHPIEVLINNAGFGINKSFTKSTLAAEDEMLEVLVRTPMKLMHAALPFMKERNSGTIINVSSVAGYIAGGTYSASKSYLTVLSESLHTELRATHINILALCPGFTRTEFHQRASMKMGALPQFAWLDADSLVATAWSDAMAGKAISVPGALYKTLIGLMRILPRSAVRKVGMNLRTKQR